jgi:hypothetical protein
MKKLASLLAWFYSSDFRMITFWIVLCGGVLIILIITGAFDSFTTNELSGPVARRR